MNWYYAEAGQQRGPISDWDFANAARTGAIRPDTLVWHEGLPEWTPLARVRPDLVTPPNAAMMGGMAIPEQQKALLVQQMREGVLPANLYAGSYSAGSQYVGFWWRLLAFLIDALVLCMVSIPIQMIFPPQHLEPHGNPFANINWWSVVVGQVVNLGYYTAMVGAFGGSLGKLALGFRIVRADGAKVSYPRAFARAIAIGWLNGLIMMVIAFGLPILVIVVSGGLSSQMSSIDFSNPNDIAKLFPPGVILMAGLAFFVGYILGTFPWWMAGVDSQKRALHDRVCSTRVVRAPMR